MSAAATFLVALTGKQRGGRPPATAAVDDTGIPDVGAASEQAGATAPMGGDVAGGTPAERARLRDGRLVTLLGTSGADDAQLPEAGNISISAFVFERLPGSLPSAAMPTNEEEPCSAPHGIPVRGATVGLMIPASAAAAAAAAAACAAAGPPAPPLSASQSRPSASLNKSSTPRPARYQFGEMTAAAAAVAACAPLPAFCYARESSSEKK